VFTRKQQGHTVASITKRSQQPDRLGVGEVFGVIGLIALQILVAAAFYVVVILLSFNSDSCSGSGTCNYGLAGVSLYLIPIVAVIAVLLSVVFTIVFTRRGRSAFISPALGIVIVVVAGVVAAILNLNAFT
jgi:hypothetical protein